MKNCKLKYTYKNIKKNKISQIQNVNLSNSEESNDNYYLNSKIFICNELN